jgi:hypothetical protein
MRARRIIDGAAFGPDVLRVVRQAFDEAWEQTSPVFTDTEHENAREVLAHAVMSAAREDSTDVAAIRDAGIRVMRRQYPSLFKDGTGGRKSQHGQ